MAMQKADTYWAGKGLGRAARIAEIADQVGDTGARDAALGAIRSTLTDWFTASPGKSEQLFYYDKNWGTLIGYPASYGSDQELNDHHFHYGYFIAAAATLARFDPAWASTGTVRRHGRSADPGREQLRPHATPAFPICGISTSSPATTGRPGTVRSRPATTRNPRRRG